MAGQRVHVPGLRILVTYGLLEKSGESTARGTRAYYRMPDRAGIEAALAELLDHPSSGEPSITTIRRKKRPKVAAPLSTGWVRQDSYDEAVDMGTNERRGCRARRAVTAGTRGSSSVGGNGWVGGGLWVFRWGQWRCGASTPPLSRRQGHRALELAVSPPGISSSGAVFVVELTSAAPRPAFGFLCRLFGGPVWASLTAR